jgi:hypothetical protein
MVMAAHAGSSQWFWAHSPDSVELSLPLPSLATSLSEPRWPFSGGWVNIYLVKNMKVSWDDYSQYIEYKIHVPNHQYDT